MLYRVTLPYACYGIVVREETVVFAAPIARWMVGKTFDSVQNWIKRRGGTVDQL